METPDRSTGTEGPTAGPASPEARRRKDWTLAYALAAAVGLMALFAIVTSPVANLLGDSSYAIPSTLHGVSAIVYVIVSTVLAYMAYLMFVGRLQAWRDVRILSLLSAFFTLLTVLFGNWIYIAYRASAGPRSYFLENNAPVHEIFFEFKEFMALVTLPLSVAAAFVLWRERETLADKGPLRQAAAVMLILSWLTLLLVFGLGAAITKLRSV